MGNCFRILWTDNALKELDKTLDYLEQNFSHREIKKLAFKIESIVQLLSKNPHLFPKAEFKEVRRVPILRYNTMYYRIIGNQVHILSFFSNRKNPKRRKLG